MSAEDRALAAALDAGTPQRGLRRSALLLHSMTDIDRGWMLSRLETSQREALGRLIDELRTLGFPADPALLGDALRDDSTDGDGFAPSNRFPALERLTAGQAAELLHGEPDRLVALLLRAGPWPWQAEFLRQAGQAREARLRGLGGPEVLADAVCMTAERAAANLLEAA